MKDNNAIKTEEAEEINCSRSQVGKASDFHSDNAWVRNPSGVHNI